MAVIRPETEVVALWDPRPGPERARSHQVRSRQWRLLLGVRFKWGPLARWWLTWGEESLRQCLREEGGTWLGLRKEGRPDPGRVEAEKGTPGKEVPLLDGLRKQVGRGSRAGQAAPLAFPSARCDWVWFSPDLRV